ncbi:MAG: DUF190 domain-containing protein [Anaerolineae bacterium]
MSAQLAENAQRLTIYIGESDRWRGRPLYAVLLELLKVEGLAGATVLRGVAGFGAHSRIHTAAILRLSEDLPLRIEVVDKADKIAHAVEVISPLIGEGLITLEEVQVIKYTHRYLNPLPADKTTGEVMTREVVSLTTDMSVAEAWQTMLHTLLKALPVVNHEGKVVGMLTDEDLLERAGVAQRLAVAERLEQRFLDEEIEKLRQSHLTVEAVMTKPAITVRPTDSIAYAAARMARHQIKRLPVVDEQGHLLGILSRVDILRLVAQKESHPTAAVPFGAAKCVRDIMSSNIPVVRYDDDLRVLVDTFLEGGYHRLIVVNEEGRAIGLVSDADVIARIQPAERRGVLAALSGQGKAPQLEVTAAELMSAGVLTVQPETSLIEAARLMLQQQRKWLVVVDSQEHPLGLVDRHLLLRALTSG